MRKPERQKPQAAGRPLFLLCAALISILGAACAGTTERGGGATETPPGIDVRTATRAFQVADSNFVSGSAERDATARVASGKQALTEADEFWRVLEQKVTRKPLDPATVAEFDARVNAGSAALSRWQSETDNGTRQSALLAARAHCERARENLEQAVRLNPFDKNARVLLAMTYYNLQHYFDEGDNFKRAVRILERLTRLEMGEHGVFRLLAENYMGMRRWDKALLNFRKGRAVLLKTSFESPPDSSDLFYYAYMQGDAHARMQDAANAARQFLEASRFARTPQERADTQNYLEWIKWDGGNIRAAELWDKMHELERSGNHARTAAVGRKLLNVVRTQPARLAVLHKLAVIEFEYLNRRADAVIRMRQVFDALPPAARARPSETTRNYLDAYGAMLYTLGVAARDAGHKRVALAYFSKSVSFDWDQMARAFQEIATLVWNTPQRAIYFGERALQSGEGVLSAEETCDLFSLMVKAHKSAGQFERARVYFERWKSCRNGSSPEVAGNARK